MLNKETEYFICDRERFMNMKTVLISFCNSDNIGDLLIVETLENMINDYSYVSVMDFDLNDKKEIVNTEIKCNKSVSSFYKIYTKYIRKIYLVDRVHAIKNNINNKYINWENLDKHLENADLVIIGGGNTMFGLTKYTSSVERVLKIVEYVKSKKKLVFLSSVGIGPFKSQEQIEKLKKLLDQADYITTRDEQSFRYVDESNPNNHISTDPVIQLSYCLDRTEYTKKNSVGVCIMDIKANKVSQKDYDKYILNMINLVKEINIIEPNKKIFLYSTDINDYSAVDEVYYELKKYIQNLSKINITTIDELLNFYKTLDLVIGTRMHSVIVAFSQAIPTIGFSWQPKVDAFYQTIDDNESVFDINEIGPKMTIILNKILEKDNNLQDEINRIIIKKEELSYLLEKNEKIIEEVKKNNV